VVVYGLPIDIETIDEGHLRDKADNLAADLAAARERVKALEGERDAANKRIAAMEESWPVRTSSIHVDGPLLIRHADSGGYQVLGYRPDGSRYSERLHPDRASAIAAALAPAGREKGEVSS
jgi:hypothetical protein